MIHLIGYCTRLLSIKKILLGEEHWAFLGEVAFRSFIMFIIVLTGLRLLGKRGVKQLSVFELVVIITLGSAAGDPMFYKEVGILTAMMVFVIIVAMYRLLMYLVGKSAVFEKMLEGKPACLIEEGSFSVENFKKESLAKDEFFAELRLRGVSQLGQIKSGIIETSGEVSLLFYADEEVREGLPIWPGEFEKGIKNIVKAGTYACTFCGQAAKLPTGPATCGKCGHHDFVEACSRKRVG